MTTVTTPILYFPDPTTNRPVSLGSLYIGQRGTNPKTPSNQIQARAVQENGSFVNIPQPIALSAGGVAIYNGNPVHIDVVETEFSILVDDRNDSQVYFMPNGGSPAPATGRESIIANGGLPFDAIRTITASTTLLAADDYVNSVVLVDASSGNINVVLEEPNAYVDKTRIIIKKIDSSDNIVTIVSTSALIDGAANVILSSQYKFVELATERTAWFVISEGVNPTVPIDVQSANYTAVRGDSGNLLRFTADATLALSPAAELGTGWAADVLASGGDVTIDPNGSETINGMATLALQDGRSLRIHGDGTQFYTSADYTGLSSLTIFSSPGSSGTYTPPVGCRALDILIIGGGGGGGGTGASTTGQSAAGGSGSAGAESRNVTTSIPSSIAYTVGAAGAAGTAGVNNGGNGGATTFSGGGGAINMTANGGAGGQGQAATAASGGGGPVSTTPATASGGRINTSGAISMRSRIISGEIAVSPVGADTTLGRGGRAITNDSLGVAATGFGSGGSGSSAANVAPVRAGGLGGGGVIVIREFY